MRGKGRAWDKAEDEYVRQNYEEMPTIAIAEKLGRSYQSVGSRAWVLGITKRNRASGTSNKAAVPEESWPVIEKFLSRLCYYAKVARRAGIEIDVGAFLTEYVRNY